MGLHRIFANVINHEISLIKWWFRLSLLDKESTNHFRNKSKNLQVAVTCSFLFSLLGEQKSTGEKNSSNYCLLKKFVKLMLVKKLSNLCFSNLKSQLLRNRYEMALRLLRNCFEIASKLLRIKKIVKSQKVRVWRLNHLKWRALD